MKGLEGGIKQIFDLKNFNDEICVNENLLWFSQTEVTNFSQ